MNSLYTRLDALLRSDAGARGFSANAGAAVTTPSTGHLFLGNSHS